MNDLVQVAVAKLVAKNLPDVPVGRSVIDETITLRVQATLNRGEDYTTPPTVSIPLKATLALMLAKMGFQREAASELLVEAMQEALAAETLGADSIKARMKDVDAAMARVQAITAALPPEPRKGRLDVRGTVEVVEPLPEAA